MKFEYYSDHHAMSQRAGKLIYDELLKNPDLLLCAASGNSPSKTYAAFKEHLDLKPISTDNLTILKLDEWGGIPMNDAQTCESYLQQRLIQPLHVSPDRFISFNSDSTNLLEECSRIRNRLAERGPIDLCILGIGKNGHLGFNEPSAYLNPYAHIAKLEKSTLQHSMASSMMNEPSFGLTLGMAEIIQSKKILLLISGKGKQSTIDEFMTGNISTYLPASFLWLHPDVICLFDNKSSTN